MRVRAARLASHQRCSIDSYYSCSNYYPAAKSLNTKQLQMDLENGTMTRDTASYHIMLDQLYEEQQKRAADDGMDLVLWKSVEHERH